MKFANFLSLIRCKLKKVCDPELGKLDDSPLMNLGRVNFALDDIHN